ncbi:hypothetical protein NA56DRAFT_696220 [Hyaloscypha hepaticicola]|uniref:Uncharacterized protein n=1 Tax=Hyaloscypha hepaticicola TaxID=2082293 RepID=A0A2J6QQA8_9HELO|nr:hypothetical protein NA56DRAFT_696220 [Hyaloscypha hepaticicola]
MGLDSMQVQSMRLVDFLPLPIYQSSNRTSTAISGMFSTCGFKSGREERQLLKTPPFQIPLPICGLYAFLTPIGENLPHPSPQVIFRGLNSQSIKPELQGPNLIHQKQKSLKTVNWSAITTAINQLVLDNLTHGCHQCTVIADLDLMLSQNCATQRTYCTVEYESRFRKTIADHTVPIDSGRNHKCATIRRDQGVGSERSGVSPASEPSTGLFARKRKLNDRLSPATCGSILGSNDA